MNTHGNIIFGQPAHVNYRTCDIFVCDSSGNISVQLAEKDSIISIEECDDANSTYGQDFLGMKISLTSKIKYDLS